MILELTGVLLIVMDDVGVDMLERVSTPNIDWLAEHGHRYERFVGSPNCSNFRAKLESGRYSIRRENLIGGIFNGDTYRSMVTGPWNLGERTHSMHIGKWHLSMPNDYGHRFDAGYDRFAGSQANLLPGNYEEWEAVVDGVPRRVTMNATVWTMTYAVDAMIHGYGLVNVSFNAVHKPAPKGVKPLLEQMDGAIGQLQLIAQAHGYAIILCSDNGGTKDNGGKKNLSRHALDVPLIVWGLEVNGADVVDATDLYATIIHATTGSLDWGDGISLLRQNPGHRTVAFADRFGGKNARPHPLELQECATDGTYKVIRDRDGLHPTTWDDEPVELREVRHLVQALEAR